MPAFTLYERLGFTQYSSSVLFSFEQSEPLPGCPMPEPYRIVPAHLFDWRMRYELALVITPQDVCQFDPVREELFRQPAILRPLIPLITRVMGTKNAGFAVRLPYGKVVARGGYFARLKAGGVNSFDISADPAHPAAVKPLMVHLLGEIERTSPGRRVELSAAHWQPATIAAAEALGMRQVLTMHDMGLHMNHRSSSE